MYEELEPHETLGAQDHGAAAMAVARRRDGVVVAIAGLDQATR